MKKALVVVLIVSLLIAVALIAHYYLTVDKCLDQGGRWNGTSRECEIAQQGESTK